jgi:hypothetical protein
MESESNQFSTAVSSFEVGGESLGAGLLVVTDKRVLFVPSVNGKDVYFFDYRSIALHAISTRGEKKFVFLQLMSDDDVASDEDDDVNENNQDLVQIFPVDETAVAPLFEHMNAMSALHPDTDTDDEGDYDEAYDPQDAGDGSVPE